jgi:alanine racemase
MELRESGIKNTILILGVVLPDEVALAIDHDITLTVASLEWLDLAKANSIDLSDLHVHIKIDSGMGRIGVRDEDELLQLVAGLEESGVSIDGVFTHFATADEKDNSYFNQQLETFKKLVAILPSRPKVVHASNSATTLWHDETIVNAVRLGVIIYGMNPSGRTLDLPYHVKPALTLKSQLVHVKELDRGQKIGYGITYETPDSEWIGTVPIGYADGWTRDLSGFHVLVDGQFCEIVGRVSMDQITIRLPKSYQIGTTVTLIGQDGDNRISATDVAEKRGTINYEVVCLLSDRIPRYFD